MVRPSPPRRRSLVAAVAAALVLTVVATGCDAVGGSTAATVEGHDISSRRVFSLLKGRRVAADRSTTGAQNDLIGPGKDTFTKRSFTDTLNQMVLDQIVRSELERRHLTIKSADRKAAKTSLEQSAGAATIRQLPTGLRNFVVDFAAAQSVLRAQLGKKGETKAALAQAQYDKIKASTPEQLEQLCVTGAVFSSKASAATAQKRLQGGASLTAAVKGLPVQQAVSKEQCAAASQFPAEVQKLGVGKASAPIANQGTYVVLILARRKTLSFAEVRAQIEQNLPEPGTAELQAEIGKLVAKADVHVDAQYGSWNRQAGRVDPPAGTPTTIAPVTSPSTPAASGSSGGATAPSSSQPGG